MLHENATSSSQARWNVSVYRRKRYTLIKKYRHVGYSVLFDIFAMYESSILYHVELRR